MTRLSYFSSTSPYRPLSKGKTSKEQDPDGFPSGANYYTLTSTCCQIDLIKLFRNGFSTGHGYLREPNDISSYAALACIAIQSNQNDQHGGQSIPNFEYAMTDGVKKTYRRKYVYNIARCLEMMGLLDNGQDIADKIAEDIYCEKGTIHVDLSFSGPVKVFSIPGIDYTIEKADPPVITFPEVLNSITYGQMLLRLLRVRRLLHLR